MLTAIFNGTMYWGGSGYDAAKSIVQTSDGGCAIAGRTNTNNNGDVLNATDVDGSGLHAGNDIWVVKLDANGNIQWHNVIGGSNNEIMPTIIQTMDGGYAIASETRSTDGDASAAGDVDFSGNHGLTDFWVIKLDTNGIRQWHNVLGGTGLDYANGIVQTPDSGYVIAGHTESSDGDVLAFTDVDGNGNHGGRDYWVIKLNSSGVKQWHNVIGGTMWDYANSIDNTCSGGVLVTGESYTDRDGDKTEPNTGFIGEAIWAVHLDASGNILWDKTISAGGANHAELLKGIVTKDGNYVLFGESQDPIGYDKTADTLGMKDYWIVFLGYQITADFMADTVCLGDTTLFTNMSQVPDSIPPAQYTWYFGDPASGTADTSNLQSPTHLYLAPGSYQVQLIVQQDCKSDTIVKTVFVSVCGSPYIVVNAIPDSLCKGACTNLSIMVFDTTGGPYTFGWTAQPPGFTSSAKDTSDCPAGTTWYFVTVITPDTILYDSVLVIVNLLPTADAGNDTTICYGDSTRLRASGGMKYSWTPATGLSDPAIANPKAGPDTTTTYYVTVIDTNNCQDMDSVIVITISCDPTALLFLPNVFSPNADGYNDVLYVRGSGVKNLKLMVYNRWGEKVFESYDINNGWDGTYKGKKLNTGVFAWYVEVEFLDDSKVYRKGNVTLIK